METDILKVLEKMAIMIKLHICSKLLGTGKTLILIQRCAGRCASLLVHKYVLADVHLYWSTKMCWQVCIFTGSHRCAGRCVSLLVHKGVLADVHLYWSTKVCRLIFIRLGSCRVLISIYTQA